MRNVIFDIGGVLLDWNPDRILEGYYADPAERAVMKQAVFLHADWLALDRGALSEPQLLERIRARAGRALPELTGLFAAVRESLQPKPESVALLQALAVRGTPLYCLSNMPANTYAYLRQRFDFWALFRGIVISGAVQMVKPEPGIFAYLLGRYGLHAAHTVFVDDHAPNVQAAQDLGLHTVLFRDAAQCGRELQALMQQA
jgi:HAD superfamily hydrolase (TIGR01509 family)